MKIKDLFYLHNKIIKWFSIVFFISNIFFTIFCFVFEKENMYYGLLLLIESSIGIFYTLIKHYSKDIKKEFSYSLLMLNSYILCYLSVGHFFGTIIDHYLNVLYFSLSLLSFILFSKGINFLTSMGSGKKKIKLALYLFIVYYFLFLYSIVVLFSSTILSYNVLKSYVLLVLVVFIFFIFLISYGESLKKERN